MNSIIKRNLKIFFKDKGTVFFSLMSVFVIIGLYVFFLKDNLIRGYEDIPNIEALVSTWVMSGIMAVVSVTTTLGALGIMIDDKSNNTLNDFYSSPISKKSVAAAYILSAVIIGVIMSIITFTLSQLYLYISADILFTLKDIIKIFFIILISVFSGSSMMFFIITFVKTTTAYNTISTIIGTLIGFITGVYIPIGSLPSTVQTFIKIFPTSHSGILFKSIMMKEPMLSSFNNAPARAINTFKESMGIVFHWNNLELSLNISIIILIISTIVFYLLAVLNLSRQKN